MSAINDIMATGTTDANKPAPGSKLVLPPGTKPLEPKAAKAVASSVPKSMGKHKALTDSEGDAVSRYSLTLPRLQGWTFFLVANKPDPNTGCPTTCLLYTSPSPRDLSTSRMPSSA